MLFFVIACREAVEQRHCHPVHHRELRKFWLVKNPRPSWAVAASTVRATASLDSRDISLSSKGELMI
ncbi:MAG: hypothetical protein LIO66_03820 [Akkermansia sp.]|nr:hypothetical protein [Akkermansia sp.]